jgi:ech hydrogenase subunit A
MFGIVFSNNLMWLLFFWEVTTLSSFLLIGYKQNEESINNSFRAVFMNLFGGVFFAMAIIYLFFTANTIELNQMLGMGGLVMLPVVFLAVAGITKAAQMPFSSWLLGAMVAPTPVSALLHSSTMVKAGVYILIRVAPLLSGTLAGLFVACVGGVTFVITSFIAVSQSDAKKVLAYSTVANLGLIVMCSGIGTQEAIWAAILLVIFHAIAKGLLFLCVGVVEHKLHSRDIESMDNLIMKMPRLAWMMLVGMAGMFLAPFGMLISKWAVLKALVDANPGLTVVLIYGSAATLFFWVKWMGKILAVTQPEENVEKDISKSEWTALYVLVVGTIGVCLTFPIISKFIIEPFVFGSSAATTVLSRGNVIIMTIMMGFVLLFRFSMPKKGADNGERVVETYLSGLNRDQVNSYSAPLGVTKPFVQKNYYLSKYFGERNLANIGIATSWLIIVLLVGSSLPWSV